MSCIFFLGGKSMLKVKSFYLLVALGLIAFVSSGAFAGLSSAFGPDVPNFARTISLDKYTGTDTLTDVKITLSLSIYDGQFEFDNDGSTAASVIIDLDVIAALSSADVALPAGATLAAVYDQTVNLEADDNDNNRSLDASGEDYASLNTGLNTFTVSWDVSADDFDDYVGTGTFNVGVAVSEILNITADNGVAICTIPVLADGSVTIEYSAVPEPATIAILAFGGLILRKRRVPKA
jgi:hypothetical protein